MILQKGGIVRETDDQIEVQRLEMLGYTQTKAEIPEETEADNGAERGKSKGAGKGAGASS